MALTSSTDQIVAEVIKAMIEQIADFAAIPVFVGDSSASQAVASRVIVEAQEQGDNFAVLIDDVYAKTVRVTITVKHQAPEGDATLPGKLANAITNALDSKAVSATLIAEVDEDLLALLDMLILEQDPEGSRDMDNDLFTKTLSFLATAHQKVS